ncbi:two-component sensor histidine kinase [hydrothermal vent metagenome]|uniref:histidine kinase n=1 Tax=hydrothermal vent metagenome TaxID=652676 RepID=A0A1W1CXD5_9ZZZZ
MKKETQLAALGYFTSVAMLLSFLYWYLKNEGFSESNFILASLFVLLLAGGWGYIIATHLLAPKVQLDENLSHLSSEILHELNIPLSTIKANTTLLKKRMEDEKSLQRLERINASSLRLERLYKELVYSIKKEIHPTEKETFPLYDILKERIEVFQAFERNHFSLETIDKTVYADKIGFEKMIDNLLMNAMKYSDKKTTIEIGMDGNILSIQDSGMGMDETQLLRVYERYYQGDSKKEGEGIGLALVKAYCDEENIEVQIYSKKDVGTKVSLDLSKIHI